MSVPYTFATATTAIPLSELDSNFATAITLGNTAIQLGNTVTTLNNMTLANVTISSGNVTITNVSVTTANVSGTANVSTLAVVNNATVGGNVTVTGNVSMNVATVTTANVTTSNVATSIVTTSETLSYGTANGVGYLNASKVLTTGSALTFDGNRLAVAGSSASTNRVDVLNDNGNATFRVGYDTSNNLTITRNTGDANIYLNATQSGAAQVWQLAGSEQMRLTSTGLGIGTSSPGSKLQVVGSSGSGDVQIGTSAGANQYQYITFGGSSGGTDYGWQIGRSSNTSGLGGNGAFYFYDIKANATRMSIDSSGNLGLGVTPSAFSTGKAIQIASADGGTMLGYSSAFEIGNNWYFNSGYKYGGTGTATRYVMSGGVHYWYNAPSGTAGNAISFTQAMTLDASGNQLLGTTSTFSAYAKLHVATGVVTAADSTNGGVYIGATTGGTELAYLSMGRSYNLGSTGEIALATSGAKAILFGTNNTERARIDSSGNWLVGQTSTGLKNSNSMSSEPSNGYDTISHASGTASGTAYIYFGYNGSGIGNITQNGTTGVLYNTSSDYRLKDNQQPLTGSGAFIDALQPKTWEWKADGSRGVGFIAHEVQEVSPSTVVGEKDGEQMQAMEYGSAEFIANIIAELQSLRKRVALLEGK